MKQIIDEVKLDYFCLIMNGFIVQPQKIFYTQHKARKHFQRNLHHYLIKIATEITNANTAIK